jgi:hypothetical protein
LDTSRINRAVRVISGWVRDKIFQSSQGASDDFPFDGSDRSFSALVKRYSGDITARTIADELTRVGAISLTPEGLLHLNTRAYISNAGEVDKLTILGTDVADLITTIDHNLVNPNHPRLQRKVAYNYIPIEAVPVLNAQLTEIAQASLESMDKVLAKKAVPKQSAKKTQRYVRTGVGIYYFEGEQS